jgi:hypothetical protein
MNNPHSGNVVTAGFSSVEQQANPASFWSTVRTDVRRFREEDNSIRAVIRGLLPQGFQALFVYWIFVGLLNE